MTIATSGEMKQIAAIERLIKRTLEPRTVVPLPASRRPRRDAERPAPAAAAAAAAAVPPAIDEFFFRPYEPSGTPALALTGAVAGAGVGTASGIAADAAAALPGSAGAPSPGAVSTSERAVRPPRLGALLGGRRRPGS
jgi:hypothetical protein